MGLKCNEELRRGREDTEKNKQVSITISVDTTHKYWYITRGGVNVGNYTIRFRLSKTYEGIGGHRKVDEI